MSDPPERTKLGSSARMENASTGAKSPCVAVAEDDDAMRDLLVSVLSEEGYEVIECSDGYGLLKAVAVGMSRQGHTGVDLVVSDVRMPGCTGIEFLARVRALGWSLPVIIITAFGDPETHARAERLGAERVFDKPFDIDQLLQTIREALIRGGVSQRHDCTNISYRPGKLLNLK